MAFLNKEIADALCTVITLGFVAKQREKTGAPVVFQYDKDEDKSDYEKAQRLFKKIGIDIAIGKSTSQDVFPYILGTGFPEDKKANLKKSLLDFKKTVDVMKDKVNQTSPLPRGAYIGILCPVDNNGNIVKTDGEREIYLYGPSALSQYEPKYRSLDDAQRTAIKEKYEEAKASTNNAVTAILKALAGPGVTPIDSRHEFTDIYKGKLFRSYHGMIRAMVNRSNPPANLFNVYAELALGNGTKKVSSCVPCAIFMESFGYPASSIHLGRGDNWGIPDGDKLPMDIWAANVCGYFEKGIEAIRIGGALRLHVKNDGTLCELTTSEKAFTPFDVYIKKICKAEANYSREIPEIFLESLTFEDSFTTRIFSTFDHANIKLDASITS